jgi:hypothetical protein
LQFAEIHLTSWQQIVDLAETLKGFIFRGQANASWPLTTSLERAFETYRPTTPVFDLKEYWILQEFKSKYHLYNSGGPPDTNNFEWLAILQHHGCPTRLLDFTSSLYIASYFAISTSTTDAAIWAINRSQIINSLHAAHGLPYAPGETLRDAINGHHIDFINKHIAVKTSREAKPGLVALESTKASHRLARQQGLFVAPISLGGMTNPITFLDNLAASFGFQDAKDIQFKQEDPDQLTSAKLPSQNFGCLKIIIPSWIHYQAIRHFIPMGLNEESLFPGLDGLARTLVQAHLR